MSIQPLEGSLGTTPFPSLSSIGDGANPLAQALSPEGSAGDAISRIVPPWLTNTMANPAQTAAFGPLPGLLQQLMTMLSQLMGSLGGSPYAGNGACPPYQSGCPQTGNERFFADATGASQGDPHLSFNGQKWNSMASQPDLLESDSVPGGFRLSTQVGQPNARGVTKNQSSTIALDNGATQITMNANGRATIERYGRDVAIQPGQTVSLGNGATVTCAKDGSVNVTVRDATGGEITTAMSTRNGGVDVDVNAHDVDLGGALVRGEPMQPGPYPSPVATPDAGSPPTQYAY